MLWKRECLQERRCPQIIYIIVDLLPVQSLSLQSRNYKCIFISKICLKNVTVVRIDGDRKIVLRFPSDTMKVMPIEC